MKKQPKIIRTSDNFFLLYHGKKSGIKVYSVMTTGLQTRESKLFDYEVYLSIRYMRDENFENECLGLLDCQDFHIEQIGQE